jgi:hypothetical protein
MTDKTESQLLSDLMDLVREQDRVTTLLAKKTVERLNKEIAVLQNPATAVGGSGAESEGPISIGVKPEGFKDFVDEDKERADFEVWFNSFPNYPGAWAAWLERARRG